MSASHSLGQSPSRKAEHETISLGVRLATLVVIVLPVLGLIAAAFFLWGWGFSWVDFGLLLGMYFLTAVGITVGFHRLFVHRSFETTDAIKFILAALGSMAVEAPMFKWVAVHRRHHQHSDELGDPHSPHHHGPGLLGWARGYWHAHIGWFFDPDPPDLDHYIKDLQQSRSLRVANSLFLLWVILGLVLPAVLGGILSQSWTGVWTGLIWGGLVRIFLVHHVTWSVNSACHLWGFRPYKSDDESRNNYLFGILALGEGFHNTHHAFPTSARHGLRWWQIDMSYWIIRSLALVGLAWNVKLPTKEAQALARRNRREEPGTYGDNNRADPPSAPSAEVLAPPLTPLLMMIFWLLLGAATGINLTQAIWRLFGWEVGEVSIAVPVGGGVGALLGALVGMIRNPRVLVLVMAIFAGSTAGAVAGRLPWGLLGEVAGQFIGGLVGGIAWYAWLFFDGMPPRNPKVSDPSGTMAPEGPPER